MWNGKIKSAAGLGMKPPTKIYFGSHMAPRWHEGYILLVNFWCAAFQFKFYWSCEALQVPICTMLSSLFRMGESVLFFHPFLFAFNTYLKEVRAGRLSIATPGTEYWPDIIFWGLSRLVSEPGQVFQKVFRLWKSFPAASLRSSTDPSTSVLWKLQVLFQLMVSAWVFGVVFSSLKLEWFLIASEKFCDGSIAGLS